MTHPYTQPDVIAYSGHIAASYRHWLGEALLPDDTPEALADALYHAPFVLISHDAQPDPRFCYANLAAQRLWGRDWQHFTGLPSRLSAEPDAQTERERLLARAAAQGHVDDYSGIRVTASGKRFRILDCVLWNVLDNNGQTIGQAACFDRWEWL